MLTRVQSGSIMGQGWGGEESPTVEAPQRDHKPRADPVGLIGTRETQSNTTAAFHSAHEGLPWGVGLRHHQAEIKTPGAMLHPPLSLPPLILSISKLPQP